MLSWLVCGLLERICRGASKINSPQVGREKVSGRALRTFSMGHYVGAREGLVVAVLFTLPYVRRLGPVSGRQNLLWEKQTFATYEHTFLPPVSSCRTKDHLITLVYAKLLDLSKGSYLLFFICHACPHHRRSTWIQVLI